MTHKPTHASVTSEPCDCGYLQESASQPECPIVLDDKTGEFHFTFIEEGCEGLSTLILYHCPFCGGAAPESKRILLFEVIPKEEEARLAMILNPIQTMEDALDTLGKPDFDDFSVSHMPERQGKAPTTQYYRMACYQSMSSVAEVCITEHADGKVHWQLQGKPLER